MAMTTEQQEEICTILAKLFEASREEGRVLWEQIYNCVSAESSFKIENWIDVRNCVCAFQQIGIISYDRENVYQETYYVL